MKCQKCNNQLILPDLNEEQKQELLNFVRSGSKLRVVQRLRQLDKLDLKNAKALMMHINPTYGQCHECGYQGLNGTYVTCPNCKSTNTNWPSSS